MMDDKSYAVIEVRQASANAGDASGNADAAVFLFESGDISGAIYRVQLVQEQVVKAKRAAAQAEWRLRLLMDLAA